MFKLGATLISPNGYHLFSFFLIKETNVIAFAVIISVPHFQPF